MKVAEPGDIASKKPSEITLDIVLKWSEKIGQPGTAKVMGDTLIVSAVNHLKQFVMINVPLSKEPARIGSDPRWNLVRLGSTVWKLTPSILDEKIHGYVTIVEVPDPPPWEASEASKEERGAKNMAISLPEAEKDRGDPALIRALTNRGLLSLIALAEECSPTGSCATSARILLAACYELRLRREGMWQDKGDLETGFAAFGPHGGMPTTTFPEGKAEADSAAEPTRSSER